MSVYVADTIIWLRKEDGRVVRLAKNIVLQNEGDFVDVILIDSSSSSSSSSVCHAVRPLVDPFRSHVPRSLFRGLPLFLLPIGQ